jgi:L-lactate dehydrogenase (cytochrome)
MAQRQGRRIVGGRQLDGAPSSISMLPMMADTVGSEIEVMFDGGIRSDGLGAGGQAGVTKAIELIGKELDVTMALTGVKNIEDIDRRVLAS